MPFIADLHIHSHFSVATSGDLRPEFLDYWARIKGIRVVGTGDFTHPGWIRELREKLEPAEPGLFTLKKELRSEIPFLTYEQDHEPTRFVLTAEISNIYKKAGKVRKVHNVLIAPDFETVEKFQQELLRYRFNITSDGRPILGLDSRNLLEMALNCSKDIFFIPAHIWTPWFSALGAQSGFDSIDDCYGDLTHHIHAVEMGLSSDPPMNWTCSFLDRFTLIANSDAHSPEKLGRNANLMETDLSFTGIIQAMIPGQPGQFMGTINFFPQEGKYHYAGHRKCGICWDPGQTLQYNGICPVCGKPVTMGVLNRVRELADRDNPEERPDKLPYYSLIPLKELLAEINRTSTGSKQVSSQYRHYIQQAGSEFNILLHLPIGRIEAFGNPLLAEAVKRMRGREVIISEGYDGEYGTIRVFVEGETEGFGKNGILFTTENGAGRREAGSGKREAVGGKKEVVSMAEERTGVFSLNPEQQQAADHLAGPALVVAGPGTGKTRILTQRIGYLVKNHHIDPGKILAITFTNKAADEIRERLGSGLGKDDCNKTSIMTFHGLGYQILQNHAAESGRRYPFLIIDEEDKKYILRHFLGVPGNRISHLAGMISAIKQEARDDGTFSFTVLKDPEDKKHFETYQSYLRKNNAFDLDDLIAEPVRIFFENPFLLNDYRHRFPWILIDEYQDVNQAQYRLIRMLMPDPSSNLFTIGDPDQAIYGFRGADVRFIRQFRSDFPGAPEYRLKQSYRCSNQILKVSSRVIGRDSLNGLHPGLKVRIIEQATDKSEAEFIARTIEQMIGGVRFFSIDSKLSSGIQDKEFNSLSDFAILCRIGRQMQVLETALNNHSIPFQSITEEPFLKQHPVSTIIDLLKLSLHPDSNLFITRLRQDKELLPVDPFQLRSQLQGLSVCEAIRFVTGQLFRNQPDPEGQEILRLLHLAGGYGNDLMLFIRSVSLGTSADTFNPDTEKVSLMTLHASKGLEFKCVFIAGCEEGLIPYSLFKDHLCDREEEKRLLYVGMTRSMKQLWICHSRRRELFGQILQLQRSHFLDKIEAELIELMKEEIHTKKRDPDNQLSLF